MCRLWVSNLERSTHRALNVVIGTPKPSSRHLAEIYSTKVVFFGNFKKFLNQELASNDTLKKICSNIKLELQINNKMDQYTINSF